MKDEVVRDQTCCFTGHRDIMPGEYRTIRKRLQETITQLIGQGVIYFGTGGARGFDTLAAQVVLSLKPQYPYIKLILVLPCRDQTKGWSGRDKSQYESIKDQADKVRVLAEQYYRGCMLVRNRHLVDGSRYCIAYQRKDTGGTAYTVHYARQKQLQIIEL